MAVSGNIVGLKKEIKTKLESLEQSNISRDTLCSPDIAQTMAEITSTTNREVALYLDRQGRIIEVIIGDHETVPLQKIKLRRSEGRLAGIRCIHTHPSGESRLSELDLTVLKQYRLDAMVSVGVMEERVTGFQIAFLRPASKDSNEVEYLVYGPLPGEQLVSFPFRKILNECDREISKTYYHLNEKQQEVALLLGGKSTKGNLLSSEESLKELEELAKTAGASIAGVLLLNKDKPDSRLYVGSGKVKELCHLKQQLGFELIILDDELSPRQQVNLEEATGCKIIDRTALILQIFADRARTKEGQLQVELAQLNYLLPRLTGYGTALSRLGGGIGTRGPGETKLETDRRHIRKRLSDLQREIEAIKKQRQVLRKQRQSNQEPVVALVGYTNAGKSTLMNALTGAGVTAEDKLFATLDPTTRRLNTKQGEILLTDTVGFIHKLPTQLIAAFRATLEEINHADLLLHVVDASSPAFLAQMGTVHQVLEQLGAGQKPSVLVLNKWDLIEDPVLTIALVKDRDPIACVSALNGYHISELIETIRNMLPQQPRAVKLCFPYNAQSQLNLLYQHGREVDVDYQDDGIYCEALLTEEWINKMQTYVTQKE